MLSTGFIFAQSAPNIGHVSGNFEIDAQYYQSDSAIGATVAPEKAGMNAFCNINYVNGPFSAGVRYESYLSALQGYDQKYKGTGIPYRFATYTKDDLEVTVGSSYEQFGNGLIFRTYEERGLLYDNALEGVRLRYKPYNGVYLKGIWGKQRAYFGYAGLIRGFDGEVVLNELFDSCFAKCQTNITIGGSFVSKYQQDASPDLVLPENVGASAGRLNIQRRNIRFNAEYVYKINDPSAANNYSYRPGNAAYASFTYSKRGGIGLTLSGERIDNMSFRSDRGLSAGSSQFINYIPALTRQHTYMLAAYYPYNTQTFGQYGWQGEFSYKFKRDTPLGGKYGTDLTINYSAAYGLDTSSVDAATDQHHDLYSADNFNLGEQYYQDINIEIGKKLNKKLKGSIMYLYQLYDKNVLEGKTGYPLINAQIGIIDITYHAGDNLSFHTDAEHMTASKEDKGNWAALLEEVTIGEHWSLAAWDQWDYGNEEATHRFHYVNAQATYLRGASRIAIGYGKQRAGIFCVGGVCRFVPATNGFTLSITSSF